MDPKGEKLQYINTGYVGDKAMRYPLTRIGKCVTLWLKEKAERLKTRA